jgi:hypothetical protein
MRAPILLLALAAAAGPALAADLSPEVAGLVQEGEKWFNEAGKTDLPMGERNEARKKSWISLYRAKEILDRHWEEHPGDQEWLEDHIIKVGKMVFWLKKESPIGLLEGTGVGPKPTAPSRKLDWGPKPPPEKPGNVPGGDAPPPANPAGPGAPAAPAGPAAPPRPPIEEGWKGIEDWSRKYRADLPGIATRLQEFLVLYKDQTGHRLFLQAARKYGDLNGKLKDYYRKARDEDPDSLKDVDTAEVKAMVLALSREMASPAPEDRRRAAGLLALLGSGEGVFPILGAARKEKDPALLKEELDAVVAIGGRKAVEKLGALRDDPALGEKSLEALQAISGRNPVDRRIAIQEMGDFAMARDEALASKAVDLLLGAGAEGAYGLVRALDSPSTAVRLKIIPALAATGNPKVGAPLARFLLMGDNPNTVRCREAARDALISMGEPVVPHLFAGLRNPGTKIWTGEVLRKITGQAFGSSRPGDWVNWWKRTHPDWKEEKE